MAVYSASQHTFVVCAYGESPYLSQCIDSLLAQKERGRILISTSTPNELIQKTAEKYQLPLFVNQGRQSIADDWNFGYRQAETPLITIAHQDDIYLPEYLSEVIAALNQASNPLIAFTDYQELRGDSVCESNRLLSVKRTLLTPLKSRRMQSSRFVRRRVLSMGSPICCPSVTFVRDALPKEVFAYGYKSNVDWQAWEMLSRQKGSFVYVCKPLMRHRIHAGSETTRVLKNHIRGNEDYEMFCRFWPAPIAKLINRVYSGAEKSNG